ncbi:sugar phosphate isomerase/epimerase family protein [Sanguibacter antarcticus]|nr:sugar phosphate isomerase/epimerase family protein [Sanguibacter antarcticus]
MTRQNTGPLGRLSLNTATTKALTLTEAVDGAARAGCSAVGLWRDRVHEVGAEAAGKIVRDAGLRVSSLCRAGLFTASDEAGIASALADNRSAVVEAATVGSSELVFVVGGLPASTGPGPARTPASDAERHSDRDLVSTRQRVADRIADLAPFAAEHGVRIVLEPLHPIFVADRAVLSTLGQALDLAAPYPSDVVGVAIDTYHVWWDPDLQAQIARAGAEGRIASYQVCDWVLPLAADPLLSRGYMGDGYIDFRSITQWITAAGYTGDVEVEIFNQAIWDADTDTVVRTVAERYTDLVLPYL